MTASVHFLPIRQPSVAELDRAWMVYRASWHLWRAEPTAAHFDYAWECYRAWHLLFTGTAAPGELRRALARDGRGG